MLVGFARSGAALLNPTALIAVLITVVLPAAGGVALLRGAFGRGPTDRMRQLRQQTIEAEVLKFAMQQQGRLTSVEVASRLGLTTEDAKQALDEMVRREVAELEISEEGLLVYTFHDARYVDGKSRDLLRE
jgi:hypothetical protein